MTSKEVARFFFLRHPKDWFGHDVMSEALKFRVTTLRVAELITARLWRGKGRVIIPQRLIRFPTHLSDPDRKLLIFVLDHFRPRQTPKKLLWTAARHNDIELAALVFHSGVVKVPVDLIVWAIQNNLPKMVKVLCQHPVHPGRFSFNGRGPTICPRLLFAALSNEEVAKYFAAILGGCDLPGAVASNTDICIVRELHDRRFHLRARFTPLGKFAYGHGIGK